MKQSFDTPFRQKLSDHEELPPAGLWDAIALQLDADAADNVGSPMLPKMLDDSRSPAPLVMQVLPREKQANRRIGWFAWTARAAAVAALLATGGYAVRMNLPGNDAEYAVQAPISKPATQAGADAVIMSYEADEVHKPASTAPATGTLAANRKEESTALERAANRLPNLQQNTGTAMVANRDSRATKQGAEARTTKRHSEPMVHLASANAWRQNADNAPRARNAFEQSIADAPASANLANTLPTNAERAIHRGTSASHSVKKIDLTSDELLPTPGEAVEALLESSGRAHVEHATPTRGRHVYISLAGRRW